GPEVGVVVHVLLPEGGAPAGRGVGPGPAGDRGGEGRGSGAEAEAGRVDTGGVQFLRGEPQGRHVRPLAVAQRPGVLADPGEGHAPFGAGAAARLGERGRADVEGIEVGSVLHDCTFQLVRRGQVRPRPPVVGGSARRGRAAWVFPQVSGGYGRLVPDLRDLRVAGGRGRGRVWDPVRRGGVGTRRVDGTSDDPPVLGWTRAAEETAAAVRCGGEERGGGWTWSGSRGRRRPGAPAVCGRFRRGRWGSASGSRIRRTACGRSGPSS